jgi:hypothetical protein
MSQLILDVNSLNREQGHNVSEKYKVIKTGELVSQLENEGYAVRELKVQRSRKPEYRGFGIHALRMRHENLILNREGLTPEIVLRNSYNGTSCFEIMMGVFRLVCSNGLVVGTTYESLKVRHVGDVMPKVIAAMQSIQSQTEKMGDDIARFSALQLSESQAIDFARRIANELVPTDALATNGPVFGTVRSDQLLKVRRSEDQGLDLWSVLNRIQENALQGGLQYITRNENGNTRNATVRRINSIDRGIKVNRLVWDVANEIVNKAA